MTANEWMVVIVAAAAFVLINIFMWTVIAAKHRHTAENTEQPAPVIREDNTLYINNNEPEKTQKISRRTVQPEPQKTVPAERKKRDDFRLIDNIIIVHTNERL